MQKVLLISILIFCQAVQAADQEADIKINMDIIKEIESSGNPQAYNQTSGASGLYQITNICLNDYNHYHTIQYTKDQLFNPEINYKVADWYINKRIPQLLEYYNLPDTVKNRLIAYNAGITKVKAYMLNKKIPQETKNYIKKYFRLLDNIE
ncbi:MAG: transglycosylase SLT domain-containing protein [Nanoarchaeota archaeon]